MKKFDINIINANIDNLNLDLINKDEKHLINQLNTTIFIISYQLSIKEYNEIIIKYSVQLIDAINEALNNIDKYNINIILYAVYNSLKLLNIFMHEKAQLIWDKFFVNTLAEQNEPEMLFNEESSISSLKLS